MQQSNPNSGGVATLAMSTTIIIMSKTNYIISWFKVTKKKKQCRRVLMDLSKYNFNWELDKINKDIKDTFYIMSKAWTNMDQDIAIEYSTKKLYENHKTKLEWMKIRNERNILKMEKLISAKVIGIETNNYENVDIIWVYIIGSMIDYIERDGRIVGGNKFISKPYVEYWKFK